MKKSIHILLKTVYIVAIPLAIIAVVTYFLLKSREKDIQTLADTMEYHSSVYNAANYSQLLILVREGNMTSLVERLEYLSDISLLMAASITNTIVLQAFPDGPWQAIKGDRQTHTRRITGERSDQINAFLEILIKEAPQHVPPRDSVPAARPPSP